MFVKFLIASHESHLPPAEESSRVHRHQNLQRSRSPHVAPWVWSSFDISSCQSNWVKRTCNYLGHPSLTSCKKAIHLSLHISFRDLLKPLNGPNWLNKIQGKGHIFKNLHFTYGLSDGYHRLLRAGSGNQYIRFSLLNQVEGEVRVNKNAMLRENTLLV